MISSSDQGVPTMEDSQCADEFPLEQAFKEVCRYHEALASEYPKFEINHSKWKRQRRITVETIDNLTEKLDKVCVYSNIGTGAGNTAEIAGGLATIFGTFLQFKGDAGSENWINIGTFLKRIGDVTIPASTLVELGFTRVYLQQVEDVLKKDQELSKPLSNWLMYSRNLDRHLREVFGCGLQSQLLQQIMRVFDQCVTMMQNGHHQQEQMLDLLRISRSDREISGEVSDGTTCLMRFAKEMEMYSEDQRTPLFERMHKIYKLFLDANELNRFCIAGLDMYREIYRPENIALFTSILTSTGYMLVTNPETRCLVRACGFEAATISANVVSLIFAAKIVMGGRSQYSDQLRDIRFQLMLELARMENHNPLLK